MEKFWPDVLSNTAYVLAGNKQLIVTEVIVLWFKYGHRFDSLCPSSNLRTMTSKKYQ